MNGVGALETWRILTVNTDRTFGIEIEAHLPAGKSRYELALFIRHEASIYACVEDYNHDTRHHWKLTTNSSLGWDRERNVEVVSPVLRGAAGVAEAGRVVKAMNDFGCTVSVKCGLHVHVGAADLPLEQMRALAINFVHCETAFDAIVPPSRRRDANHYVMSNRTAFGGGYDNESINRAIDAYLEVQTIGDLIRVVSSVARLGQSYGTRYRKLNMEAYHRYQTVEFRQHSGTVDAEKVMNWIRLCVAFVERSKTSKPRKRPSTKPHNVAGELSMMLKFLRLDKPTRDFYRKRRVELERADAARTARTAARMAA